MMLAFTIRLLVYHGSMRGKTVRGFGIIFSLMWMGLVRLRRLASIHIAPYRTSTHLGHITFEEPANP